jgi:23S rRNA pseudouridine2605 synthase
VSIKRKIQEQRVQLHRALSKLGLCSRTQAWDWIRAGVVQVDGVIVTEPLAWIDLGQQKIRCRGESADVLREQVVLALYKPRGIVTTRSDERGRRTVYNLLPAGLPWVFPVGRLDADSEGLLILTNDSRLGERLTDPRHQVAKTYQVTVARQPDAADLRMLRTGMELSDGRTLPARVRVLDGGGPAGNLMEIVLKEGRNRQVRRMCSAVGHRVRRLVRVAIGAFSIGDLAPGQCWRLGPPEIRLLLAADDERRGQPRRTNRNRP